MIIFYGGPIITMNENQPFVDAVSIKGEKIIAVGKLDNIKKEMNEDFELIDLKGNTLLPGFIESH
ncbi:MAG: amidohydrolase, partial [Promethearchaeota archaeon]